MEAATATKVISSEQSVILSMLHGLWQNRCINLIVGFEIPELLCNTEEPSLSIDDIAAKTGCNSSKQLYPIMRVLAQWGIGKELENKHFTKNQTMELLRRDLGPSLGHMVLHYGSEENLTAFRFLPKSVREGTPAFVLEHGMSPFEYINDISNQPYDAKKMYYGASKHPIGSKERREELSKNYVPAMDYLCDLAVLPDKDQVKSVYKAFPWATCNTLVDMGGNSGKFLASVLKQSGCEHIQGYVVDLPDVVDKVQENVEALGVPKSRLKFIKQDFTKPFPVDLQLEADTVFFMNIIGYFLSNHDTVTNILQHTRSIFSRNGGRLLIIDNCCPDPGNFEENLGVNGRQLGFHSLHFSNVSGGGFGSKREWVEILTKISTKSGYKFNHVYDTFIGGFKIFELTVLTCEK